MKKFQMKTKRAIKFPVKKTIQSSLQETDEVARLTFSDAAMVKMLYLIMKCPKEVGWQGTVEKVGKGKYFIDDIFTYPQATSSASIWIDDLRFGKWQAGICLEDPEYFDSIRFHGHSHVNMATFASCTDRELQDSWIELLQENQFYIFLIINKRAEFWCKIADREDGVIYKKAVVDSESLSIHEIIEDYNANVDTIKKGNEDGYEQILRVF